MKMSNPREEAVKTAMWKTGFSEKGKNLQLSES